MVVTRAKDKALDRPKGFVSQPGGTRLQLRERDLRQRRRRLHSAAFAMVVLLFAARVKTTATGSHEPPFKYVGGTEDVLPDCAGELRLSSESIAFECAQYTVTVPYAAIEIMQYRADLGRRVRKMKLKWKVSPPYGGGGKNRYFTLVYRGAGATHAIVLEVAAGEMQPYLAEIDLRAGRRVDVQRHDDYQ